MKACGCSLLIALAFQGREAHLHVLYFPPVLWPQAFTIMDQNRDGFIDKNDLRDTFAALGVLL